MAIQLPNKIAGNYLYIMVSLLITSRSTAFAYIQANKESGSFREIKPQQTAKPEESETGFTPEGFSPNEDEINDKFVIQRLPVDLTVQLEVYSRWECLAYRSANDKNDWDGTANLGVNLSAVKEDLPDGIYYCQI